MAKISSLFPDEVFLLKVLLIPGALYSQAKKMLKKTKKNCVEEWFFDYTACVLNVNSIKTHKKMYEIEKISYRNISIEFE